MIKWQTNFETGITSVDAEHRQLIEQINAALALIETALTAGEELDAVLAHMGDIHSTATAHFALEESEMRQSTYPDLETHKSDHEALLDILVDFIDELSLVQSKSSVDDLQDRLQDWFTGHFKRHDAAFHKFLTKKI